MNYNPSDIEKKWQKKKTSSQTRWCGDKVPLEYHIHGRPSLMSKANVASLASGINFTIKI